MTSLPTVFAQRHSTVATFLIQGTVYLDVAHDVADIQRQHMGGDEPALARVAQYARADIEFDMVADAPRIEVPTAYVVAPRQQERFRAFAAAQREAGGLAAVFTSHEDAHRWAAQQAQAREHWRRLRARRQ